MSTRPIKIAQFGGGVFLRGFFDWMLQKANDAHVYDGDALIIRSKTLGADPLAKNNYRYTHISRDGTHQDITQVDSIAGSIMATDREAYLSLARLPSLEMVVSNTTEAGISYTPCSLVEEDLPSTFPARLTCFLYERYRAGLHGLLILPCELIEKNGDTLKDMVVKHGEDWGLETNFFAWLDEECSFRNTLVDRIVSGVSSQENGANTSEYFHLWVIEGTLDHRLPFAEAGMNVKWVEDLNMYRTLKVRILNGAHTSMIPYALLLGVETVGACMAHKTLRLHLKNCLEEIISSLESEMRADALSYGEEVISRFSNPYIQHSCVAISLASVSKFRVRVLPSILAYYERFGTYPQHLLSAFAYLIKFYRTGTPRDEESIIQKMQTYPLPTLLADTTLWEQDLTCLLPLLTPLFCEDTLC